MVEVKKVASWFLSKSSMTHKKLQKLCYYAQAWHCTLLVDPLFEERIEAWIHGPVIPALYTEYRGYGWSLIPSVEFNEDCFAENQLDVLETVWRTYGEYDGDQLEWLTHQEEPWKQARGSLGIGEVCTEAISCESMRKYYGELYEKSQND